MADEKQNIYNTALDNDNKTITNITGPLNILSDSHRLDGKLKDIAKKFQNIFFQRYI